MSNERHGPASPEMKMYEYYERQAVLPTFADFKDEGAMQRYVAARKNFIVGKLGLPLAVFHAADLLEFGPDSGENALAFASWGARVTLVEPNPGAHAFIREYFQRFDLGGRLEALVQADVEGFRTERKFDIIDAEGFIYTVPLDRWLGVFRGLLRDDGLFVISHAERFGHFIEFCLKALHAGAMALGGLGPLEAAQALYRSKWESIPHTRTFESWVMDVMMNPFVRLRYSIDARVLVRRAAEFGFALHSSWPVYRDPLAIYWHKRELSLDDEVARALAHLNRSSLSFLTGTKFYLAGDDEAALAAAAHDLDRLLEAVDDTIDFERAKAQRCVAHLTAVEAHVRAASVVADRGQREQAGAVLAALRRAFELLASGEVHALAQFTNADPAFIAAWGMPAQFAVFRKAVEETT